LARLIARHILVLTDSELERLFLPIAAAAGLPAPMTGCLVNGYRVDFFWPDLSLVVETDGLRYHRTPVQQARDRERDQTHTAAGLTPLRFTHSQIRFDPDHVGRILNSVVARLARGKAAAGERDGPRAGLMVPRAPMAPGGRPITSGDVSEQAAREVRRP